MTEPHAAVLHRLSTDFAALSHQFARVSADLVELDRVLTGRPVWPQPAPAPMHAPPPVYAAPPVYLPPPPPRPAPVRKERSDGWIGTLLATAGVAVTLIGVVLLLVLAAQAGILRPEFRVGAGAVLAAGLVAAACRLRRRPGGRVGSIALAATGVAAAYMDVIAVTAIYHWVPQAVGLLLAAIVGGAGLTLARRWDSQRLGLLVLVPLIVLGPIVADGFRLLLVAFMLALSAAALPVQLGKDWVWMHAARVAAPTLPLLLALPLSRLNDRVDPWLACSCGVAALLALVGALVLLPGTTHRSAVAVLSAAGTAPLLAVGLVVDRVVAAMMIAALAAVLLAVVLVGDRLPGVPGAAHRVFGALCAVAALIAVTVAFDGRVAGPLLLAMAAVVAVAGRDDVVARWAAIGFGAIGAAVHLEWARPGTLLEPTAVAASTAASTLASSVLLAAAAVAIAWSWRSADRAPWAGAAAVVGYAVTSFTVTAGVLIGGPGRGFFAGHTVATICWMAMAAGLFGYALRLPRADRSMPIAGGLGLVAAAMAKLFLFDLGTLDGMFRVVVFIVGGLILLAMGSGYARLLDRQDRLTSQNPTA
jgi:uncharacterized membrane protein